MYGLSPRDRSYATLYARCAHRFPNIAATLPKPELAHEPSPPAISYAYQSQSAPQPAFNQSWSHTSHSAPVLPTLPSNEAAAFFRPRPRVEGCAFCAQAGHRLRECRIAQEYIASGRAIIKEERIHLPDGQRVPNDGTGRGIKASIDIWLAAQTLVPPVAVPPQTQAALTRDPPPQSSLKFSTRGSSASRIEEVTEAHIFQVAQVAAPKSDTESETEEMDIFEVYATEKKKREDKAAKLPELVQPQTQDTRPKPAGPRPGPQYQYQSTAEDQRLVSELEAWLFEGKLAQTTPAHVLAASPVIRKDLVEKLRARRVEANVYEDACDSPDPRLLSAYQLSTGREPEYSLPLQEIDVSVGGDITEPGVYDPGSQIVVIRQDLARQVNARINPTRLLEMEGANGATNWALGCAEYLSMQVGDVPFKIHAHVVENAPFRLLLGRPFQRALLCRLEDLPGGEVEISIRDPSNLARRIYIPSRPRKAQVGCIRILSYVTLPSCPTIDIPLPSNARAGQNLLHPFVSDTTTSSLVYKKVAKKVRPVPTSLPEDFRCLQRIPVDPLLSLPPLPSKPPDFTPGSRLTQDRLDALQLNQGNFLWPQELKLLQHVLKINELGLAWTEEEKGRFKDEYFSPVKIPVIEHIPWAHRNIPIPSAILGDVIQIFKDKFAAGVYEHSDASYRSRWFCVKKKSGALRLVHDLQPLNAVTIRNSGVPPLTDQVLEAMAGRACYSMLDLFVGYDHRTLDIASRDLTTIQSPIGAVRLTCLPQGWTNAGAIFHEDVTFILEAEIPNVAWPFMDDCSIKGPATRFETTDGSYETIPENEGIRKFIWMHLGDVHRILHRLCCAGATVSAKKLFIAVPEVIILGHKCTYEGRVPDDSKIAKIRDWPSCKNITDVRAFLGTAGFMRLWIKNYSSLARPLVNLTRKGQVFEWHQEHNDAMQALKDAIVHSPVLVSIDYTSGRNVYLAVDSSVRGVGWILSQECADGKRRPARFGSISWNEREGRYSQAKLELYGLFRALRALRLHLFGVRNLVVEMDAQFIRGMLNNPDVQPNTTINRWIAAISLFDFRLIHIPADKHHGPDGLSRREPVEGEDDEEEDPEDWIDNALCLGVWAASWANARQVKPVFASVWLLGAEDLVEQQADPFPASKKATQADEDLARVHRYLTSFQFPPNLDDSARLRFLRKTRRFTLRDGRLWRQQVQGRDQLYITPPQRLSIIRDAHDNLGHKGFYSTRRLLLDRFWWPSLEQNVKWYVDSCHQCQLRQTTKVRIPPTVATPAPLFRKAYIDTMLMPFAGGYQYIVQARCSLTAWPEWRALCKENGRTLGAFIFEEILCRWGAVEEIVTDNGTAYIAALDWLAGRYGIHHIRISAYNSRANGIVERQHRTIRESLVKACDSDTSKWPTVAPLVFWADRATIRKSTGYSPFHMAHGVEPILPFDITLATFLVPELTKPLSTADLIATRARQLEKRDADLAAIRENVLKSRFASIQHFERQFANTIRNHDFRPGDLVLVRNSSLDSELRRKTKPRYLGPMVVLRRTRNGSYRLAELDGTVSKLRYAAFRLVPYHARSRTFIPVTRVLDRDDLIAVIEEEAADPADAPNEEDGLDQGRSRFLTPQEM